jgi:hypothetical protein
VTLATTGLGARSFANELAKAGAVPHDKIAEFEENVSDTMRQFALAARASTRRASSRRVRVASRSSRSPTSRSHSDITSWTLLTIRRCSANGGIGTLRDPNRDCPVHSRSFRSCSILPQMSRTSNTGRRSPSARRRSAEILRARSTEGMAGRGTRRSGTASSAHRLR